MIVFLNGTRGCPEARRARESGLRTRACSRLLPSGPVLGLDNGAVAGPGDSERLGEMESAVTRAGISVPACQKCCF